MRFRSRQSWRAPSAPSSFLTMITGGLAYIKLNQLAATSADLVARAGRGDKAAEIQTSLLYQVRAEKNLILASSDADIAEYAAEIKKQRENALRLNAEVLSATNEAGKVLLGKFSAAYEKMNAIEDNTVKLAELNSANRAAQFWSGEGVAATKGFNDALDAALASVNRAPASVESGRALFALQTVRVEGARALRMLYQAISASSEDELAGYLKDLVAEERGARQVDPTGGAAGVGARIVGRRNHRADRPLRQGAGARVGNRARGRPHQGRDLVVDGRKSRHQRDGGRSRRVHRPGQEGDGRMRPRRRPRTPTRRSSS